MFPTAAFFASRYCAQKVSVRVKNLRENLEITGNEFCFELSTNDFERKVNRWVDGEAENGELIALRNSLRTIAAWTSSY
jgi:hypothetical protein